MSKILITGAAGFIGSHISEILTQQGNNVVALDDLSGGFIDNLENRCTTFVRESVVDGKAISELFSYEKFDYVFHLAAYAAEGLSPFIRRFNYENNLIGSVNIINECVKHKIKCLVFASSIAVYGHNTSPMIEDMQPNPADPYGVAKYAVEMDLKLAAETFGLPYIIFRAHNVYGPHQHIYDRYRNVIGIFMRQIIEGYPMTIFGDGDQKRAFSYINDVAPVMAESIKNKHAYGQIFNVGGEIPYTVNTLAAAVAAAMGVEKRVTYLKARHEPKHVYASQKKLQSYFETPTQTTLEIGLAKMVEWVRTVKRREVKKFADIEITEGLPEGWI